MENTQYLGDPQKIQVRRKIREILEKRKDPNYVKAYLYEVEGLDMDTINTEVDSILTLSGQAPTTQPTQKPGMVNIGGQQVELKSMSDIEAYQKMQEKERINKEQADAAIETLREKLGFADEILQDTQGLKSTSGAVQFQMPFSKTKQRFTGNVEGLLDVESIDALIEAKSRGATFGALTDKELQMLRSGASKIGKWAITDPETGKVTGYDIDEETLQKELTRLRDGFNTAKEKIESAQMQETPQEPTQEIQQEDDYTRAQKWLQENPEDPRAERVRQKLATMQPAQESVQELETTEPDIVEEETGLLEGIGGSIGKRFSNIFKIVKGERISTGEVLNSTIGEKALQTIGQLAALPFDVLNEGLKAGYNTLPEGAREGIESGLKAVAETEGGQAGLEALGQGVEAYQEWSNNNPREAQNLEAVVNIASALPIGAGAKVGVRAGETALSAAGKGLKTGVRTVGRGVARTGESIGAGATAVKESLPGVSRIASETVSRVPRFFKHRAEDLAEAEGRAKFIESVPLAKQSAVKEAFNTNLDKNLMIQSIEADDVTRDSYKKMIQLAEDTKAQNPNIIAGEAAEKQFDFIETKRKEVGKQIGELEKSLPNVTVNVRPATEKLSKILKDNEITVEKGKIVAPNLTKAQKSAVQELLDLISQRGTNIKPSQIHKMDQLFSNLQREKRMDKVSEIFIDVDGEKQNLFSVFRNVYTGELDKINSFRNINAEYRKYATLQDNLESTIFKGGNAELTRGIDGAEFAKTNLRRAFGEAQSSATYKELATQLDGIARELGYEGASPLVLTDFAERVRKLYPETIPTTGFQGGIQTGVGAAIEATLKAGGPKATDQIKALKRLLDMEDLKGKGEILPTTQAKQANK